MICTKILALFLLTIAQSPCSLVGAEALMPINRNLHAYPHHALFVHFAPHWALRGRCRYITTIVEGDWWNNEPSRWPPQKEQTDRHLLPPPPHRNPHSRCTHSRLRSSLEYSMNASFSHTQQYFYYATPLFRYDHLIWRRSISLLVQREGTLGARQYENKLRLCGQHIGLVVARCNLTLLAAALLSWSALARSIHSNIREHTQRKALLHAACLQPMKLLVNKM